MRIRKLSYIVNLIHSILLPGQIYDLRLSGKCKLRSPGRRWRVLVTHATWLACGKNAAARTSSSGALRGRTPLIARTVGAWRRVRAGGFARLPRVGGGLPGACAVCRASGALAAFSRRRRAAPPLSIRASVTRDGTACRSSYRPPRRSMRRVHLLITTLPDSFALKLQTCARCRGK